MSQTSLMELWFLTMPATQNLKKPITALAARAFSHLQKKYNATVDYSVKDCVFNIRIMFPCSQTEL